MACRHASTNPGSGDAPSPSATNCATAVRVNGARWSTSAEGSVASAASSPASAPASRGRVAAITAIDSPSSRGQQEREEPQRRRIRPLRVVDGEAHGLRGAEVRAQPVETVEDRERRVRTRRDPGAVATGAGELEQRRGDARRAFEIVGALRIGPLRPATARAADARRRTRTRARARRRASAGARIPSACATTHAAPSIAVLPIPAGPSITIRPPLPRRLARARRRPGPALVPRSSSVGLAGGASVIGCRSMQARRLRSARRAGAGDRRLCSTASRSPRSRRGSTRTSAPGRGGCHQPRQHHEAHAQPRQRDPRRRRVRRRARRLEGLIDGVAADRDRTDRQQQVEHDWNAVSSVRLRQKNTMPRQAAIRMYAPRIAKVAVVAMKPKYLNGSSQTIRASTTTSASVSASDRPDRRPGRAEPGVRPRERCAASRPRAPSRTRVPGRQVHARPARPRTRPPTRRGRRSRPATCRHIGRPACRAPPGSVAHLSMCATPKPTAITHDKEHVVDDPDADRHQDRARDHPQRVGGLLAQRRRRLEPDEAGEGEHHRQEQRVGAWDLARDQTA